MKVITNNYIKGVNSHGVNPLNHQQRIAESDNISGSKYLSNDLNHLSFMGKSQLIKELTPETVTKKHSEFISNQEEKLAEQIREYIHSSKKDSKELKNIDTLLECFDTKKYQDSAFDCYTIILDKNILKSLKKGQKLPDAISEDLALLRMSGNLIDNYIPILSRKDADLLTKTGDVFQLKDSKCVSIKTKEGKIDELKMNREDFFRLFPPVTRFAGIQSPKFGNCYEETALYSLMANPETRENIYKCIDTISDPYRIKVTLPSGYIKDGVSFNEGVISMNDGTDFYSKGCLGIQVIQHALGLDMEKEFLDYKIAQLTKEGKDSEVRWLQANSDKSTLLANHFRGRYYNLTLGTNLRSGGNAVVQWNKLGLKDMGESSLAGEKYTITEDSVKDKYKHETDDRRFTNKYLGNILTENLDGFWERLESPDFFKSHLVQVAVSEDNTISKFIPDHSYGLRAKFNQKGEIESYFVKNPHEITETPLTFEEVIDNFDYMSFARFK